MPEDDANSISSHAQFGVRYPFAGRKQVRTAHGFFRSELKEPMNTEHYRILWPHAIDLRRDPVFIVVNSNLVHQQTRRSGLQ